MSRILVTGASGFVGSNLVEELVRRGQPVRCLVRAGSQTDLLSKLGAELAVASFDDRPSLEAALDGVELVYHGAGLTKAITAAEFYRVNRDACASLAQACAALARPPRVVLISSVAAAGPAPRGQIRTEADPPAPISIYGASKRAGEEALVAVADRVPLTIVRPGVVFGPRDKAFVQMFRAIRRLRLHLAPGWTPPPLSFIYVADLVELLIRAAERGARVPPGAGGAPGQGCYFAAAPEYLTYADFGRAVRRLLSRPFAPVVSVPGPLAWCVASAGEAISRVRGVPSDVNYDKIREALATSWACSGEAARRDLDFVPPQPLAERFRQTVDWYHREGWV